MHRTATTRSARTMALTLVATSALGVSAVLGVPGPNGAAPALAATNAAPTVQIVEPTAPFGDRVPIRAGDTFLARAGDRDGTVVRVEWFFRTGAFDYPVDWEEPLGVSTTAPFTLNFAGPARLFLGGSLVARAYDDRGAIGETSLAVALEGSAGFVPTAVRFALPYISQAESGSARQSSGTTVLPVPTFFGAAPASTPRPIRGFSGIGAVALTAPGSFVQWAAKTSQGGASDEAIAGGRYTLTWRYNNPGTTTRSLRLTTALAGVLDEQPGAVDRGSIVFAPTRAANSQLGWRTVSTTVQLPAGINNIRLSAPAGDGPRLDYLVVRPSP